VTQGERLPDVRYRGGGPAPAQLADVLERVLDKGIVIAGDIRINLLDIELLTVRIRLLIASADKAKEMGIDWWQGDPFLKRGDRDGSALESRLRRLEERAGLPTEEERSER
jgi:Gas vesicle protein